MKAVIWVFIGILFGSVCSKLLHSRDNLTVKTPMKKMFRSLFAKFEHIQSSQHASSIPESNRSLIGGLLGALGGGGKAGNIATATSTPQISDGHIIINTFTPPSTTPLNARSPLADTRTPHVINARITVP